MTKILQYEDLRGRGIPYSKSQLWRLERAGRFPKRVRLGPKYYGYVESELDAHIRACIAERDEASNAA